MEKIRLTVEDVQVGYLRDSADRSCRCPSMSWQALSGELTLLTGSSRACLNAVMRTLAGFEKPIAGRIILREQDRIVDPVRNEITVAWLPAPGEEVFVGATVAEELAFPYSSLDPGEPLIDVPGSFSPARFGGILNRSVWELSASERRLLLLAAQARRSPVLWLCVEPLAYLDGAMERVVRDSLMERARAGAIVMVAAEHPEILAPLADELVVFDDRSRPGGKNGGLEDQPLYLAAFRAAKGDSSDKILDGLNEKQPGATKLPGTDRERDGT